MDNNQSSQTQDNQDEVRWAVRNEIIDAIQGLMSANNFWHNSSHSEAVDLTDAIEKLIEFKIQQALN